MMQKSKFIFLPLFLFAALLLHSQTKTIPKFEVGIRGGANYANFRGLQNSQLQAEASNTFIMAGAFTQVRIFKKFGLRAELLYNPKGALINYFDGNNIKVEAIRQMRYTDATFSLLYHFKVFKVIGMYAFGGYAYENLSSVRDAVQSPYTDTRTITSNFEQDAHSMIGGLGIRMRISNINIYPEIRYLHGLTDVVKTNVETKNQVITASLGVSVTL